jgi:hypothetical protein
MVLTALLIGGSWHLLGWPGLVVLVAAAAVLVAWRLLHPPTFAQFATGPARAKWRRWHYQRHWEAVMTLGRLAAPYRGRLLLPAMGKITSTRTPTGCKSGLCLASRLRTMPAVPGTWPPGSPP